MLPFKGYFGQPQLPMTKAKRPRGRDAKLWVRGSWVRGLTCSDRGRIGSQDRLVAAGTIGWKGEWVK
jgi:hypothetical protein